jgi:outer membrane lipoprotein carrier protein
MRTGQLKIMLTVLVLTVTTLSPAAPQAADIGGEAQFTRLQEILDGIDQRYAGPGFSAAFSQSSTLKALGVTDTATGRLTVKRPDKMLWIYDTPESQTIVTDGARLWIYRPADNQVMLGAAPSFFRDGKGASFLTDTRHIRDQFHVSQVTATRPGTYQLQLIPRKPQGDIARILVSVTADTKTVVEIVTINIYDDETKIALSSIAFEEKLPDDLFTFTIPDGADVVRLDE